MGGRVGIDGYLGWTLALWLGGMGYKVSGVDNYNRREWVKERGAQTIVPIARMNDRLAAAKEVLGIEIEFRQIDIYKERQRLREFIEEVRPEAIVHYAECPSAPYSMIDAEHAIAVQENLKLSGGRVSVAIVDIRTPDATIRRWIFLASPR